MHRAHGIRDRTLRMLVNCQRGFNGFSKIAWIEAESNSGAQPEEITNGPGVVDVVRRGTDLLLEAQMAGPGWVVVSETAWKGWKARTEAGRVPIVFANGAYLGLYLGAGHHRVELRYLPTSFVFGRAVSLTTVVTLIMTLVWWRRKDPGV